MPEAEAHYYAEGMRRGGVLVTVHAADNVAERAASVLATHHPIDLTQRVEAWRQSGWSRFDADAEPSALAHSTPAHTRPPTHDTTKETTIPVVTGTAPQRDVKGFEVYDADFRRHYGTAFATTSGSTYERYLPAYRYGYTLVTDKRYLGRDWIVIEPEARRSWEEGHAGTWEQFKDAIRHARDTVAGRR